MVLGAILTALATIIGGVITAGKEVVSVLSNIFQGIWSAFQSFVQSAPTPMKVAIFLAFLLTIGNVFSNFFLGMRYVCDANNQLYENTNTIDAIASTIRLKFFDWSVGDVNTYILENYQVAPTSSASPTNVKCVGAEPKLYFYSVNILDYKMWLLLLVVIFGLPIVISYYSKMGVLH